MPFRFREVEQPWARAHLTSPHLVWCLVAVPGAVSEPDHKKKLAILFMSTNGRIRYLSLFKQSSWWRLVIIVLGLAQPCILHTY
ncbi:hypothetical protein COCSADRAFT_210657 [Bipolaris sorokiniana ND90Pr]|uniref:Uncharacterized protein n=1 Tax=Cochliobolus sativus (strain ND90Pr / ATCC 201652) TaxID=665912 RepID=M2T4Z9_COCSN|nr:uncharacterized protein COCSADRAFT_210657 [Bipolaris sorokiniana ND90Pr]EMD69500.1 hypothetical protein COCSADRAFT_210657 [Bipolaris sorokiniana ND90Pr]